MSDSDNETDNGIETHGNGERFSWIRINSFCQNYYKKKLTNKIKETQIDLDRNCANKFRFKFAIETLLEINTDNSSDIKKNIKDKIKLLNKEMIDADKAFEFSASKMELLMIMENELNDEIAEIRDEIEEN